LYGTLEIETLADTQPTGVYVDEETFTEFVQD
jgi:hypothetical protein